MWYFSWILGTAFAITFGIVNAMWHEAKDDINKKCKNDCA